jgi:hypothetical protein
MHRPTDPIQSSQVLAPWGRSRAPKENKKADVVEIFEAKNTVEGLNATGVGRWMAPKENKKVDVAEIIEAKKTVEGFNAIGKKTVEGYFDLEFRRGLAKKFIEAQKTLPGDPAEVPLLDPHAELAAIEIFPWKASDFRTVERSTRRKENKTSRRQLVAAIYKAIFNVPPLGNATLWYSDTRKKMGSPRSRFNDQFALALEQALQTMYSSPLFEHAASAEEDDTETQASGEALDGDDSGSELEEQRPPPVTSKRQQGMTSVKGGLLMNGFD